MIHHTKKTYSPQTKHNFPCASYFPAKFTDMLYTKFYGFYAHYIHLKCAKKLQDFETWTLLYLFL